MHRQEIPKELLSDVQLGTGMVLSRYSTGTFRRHGDPKGIGDVIGDKNALNLLCVGAHMSSEDVYLIYRTENGVQVEKYEGKHILPDPNCGSKQPS